MLFIILLSASWAGLGMTAGTDCSSTYAVQTIDKLPAAYQDLGLNTTYYTKFVSGNGIPVMGPEVVSDFALQETARVIAKVTENLKPGFLDALLAKNVRISYWAKDQDICWIPEVMEQQEPNEDGIWCTFQHFGGLTTWGNNTMLVAQETRPMCNAVSGGFDSNLIREFGFLINGVLFGVLEELVPGSKDKIKEAYTAAKARHPNAFIDYAPDHFAQTVSDYFSSGARAWFGGQDSCDIDGCNATALQTGDEALYNVLSTVFVAEPTWQFSCDDVCTGDAEAVYSPSL